MSRQSQEIHSEHIYVAVQILECLHGIGMKKDFVIEFLDNFRNFGNRLNRPDFIVGVHYGNKNGPFVQG